MGELKPCPFCGGSEIVVCGVFNVMYCNGCGAETDMGDWNTRPLEDALNKRIAELEAESERFTVHSDIERQDDKSPNDTQTQTIVYGKESEE